MHSADNIDSSFDALFVRHLGHVKIAVEDAELAVSWDVQGTSDAAMTVALQCIAQLTGRTTYRLNYFYLGWATEQFDKIEAVLGRMQSVRQLRDVSGVPLTHVESIDPDRISAALQLWRRTDGRLAKASTDECSALLPEVLIYRPSRRTGKLVFTWVGGRSFSTRVHGRDWSKRALRSESFATIGTETADYVDRISSAYNEVWQTGAPRLDRIQTLLSPDRSSDPVWLDYHRLLLRYRLHDERDAIVCLSQPSERSFTKPPDAVP